MDSARADRFPPSESEAPLGAATEVTGQLQWQNALEEARGVFVTRFVFVAATNTRTLAFLPDCSGCRFGVGPVDAGSAAFRSGRPAVPGVDDLWNPVETGKATWEGLNG